MNLQEYERLQAERAEVERLLSRMPAERVIDRRSLESRLTTLQTELAVTASPPRKPALARLTFRGRPVLGNHGIFVEFGSTAVDKFADAIATLAASLEGPLGARGTLPNRESYRMLITGTALGSFGFELEEHVPAGQLPLPGLSPMEEAIEQARTMMEATLGTDDDLAEAASGTDRRAVAALRDFVKILADHEAVCALESDGKVFRFSDVGEVRRSVDRLSQDTIHEAEETIEGAFQGVLPHRRSFEFRRLDTAEIISGKVGGAIENAAEINRVLERDVRITVLTTRVGNGHPRYRLCGYQELPVGEARQS